MHAGVKAYLKQSKLQKNHRAYMSELLQLKEECNHKLYRNGIYIFLALSLGITIGIVLGGACYGI